MSIGVNLKAIRTRKGLTQSQVAEACGMPLTQISRIENNDTDPKVSTVKKLMVGLGCSANELFIKPEADKKLSLEDFIDGIDVRAEMDTKTVVLLWRYLEDHKTFLKMIDDTYKNDPHPHARMLKAAGVDIEKYGIKE